jgi:hypothetical protein
MVEGAVTKMKVTMTTAVQASAEVMPAIAAVALKDLPLWIPMNNAELQAWAGAPAMVVREDIPIRIMMKMTPAIPAPITTTTMINKPCRAAEGIKMNFQRKTMTS